MRIGLRARIFLVVLGSTATGLLLAQAGLAAWLGAAIAALVGASVLSAALDSYIQTIEARAAESIHQVGQRVTELSVDRAHTEAILSGMVEGVLVVNSAGRLRLINDAARQMLNLEDIALGGHYLEAARHPGIVQQLGAALGGERREPIEVPVTGRIFSAQAAPVSAVGGGGAVLVLHDITALRHADRVRRDFVANVSHELRTPLTAVRGYVEALMEEPASAEQRKFLEVIERHAIRMERLVRDLLRLATLDAQQDTVELQACDTEALYRSVVADLAGPIDRQKVRIAIAIDPEAAVVQIDPTRLHDALRNLLENAVNYSPEGGQIDLTARLNGDQVAFSVGDEGPGVPESDLGRVFERFYRVDKSRARNPGGTGLGLSIVKHLVELHGGRVQASNKQGHGALFTIEVPHIQPRTQ